MSAFMAFILSNVRAQTYCQVSSATAYTMDMPGIINFKLNTIDRTSAAIECGSVNCNSYVLTGDSTSLEHGKSYTMSMTHTRDLVIFPNVRNNIRVWIDFNQNGKMDDSGEIVVLENYTTTNTTTATFTVPNDAKLGNTRMRVTAKMSDDGGHIMPTPCDIPVDPLGYHGEIEDYTVKITASTSLKDQLAINGISIYPNPGNGKINIKSKKVVSKVIMKDITGKQVKVITGLNIKSLDASELQKGVYFITLIGEEKILGNSKFVKI